MTQSSRQWSSSLPSEGWCLRWWFTADGRPRWSWVTTGGHSFRSTKYLPKVYATRTKANRAIPAVAEDLHLLYKEIEAVPYAEYLADVILESGYP